MSGRGGRSWHVLCLALTTVPTIVYVFAHVDAAGGIVGPRDVWTHWSVAPGVVLPLAIATAWYARGVWVLRHRASRGRSPRRAAPPAVTARGRVCAFAGGLLTLIVALVSPLDAMAEALFSAHMAQHLLLILVAPPLLVLGTPLVPMLFALPVPLRHRITRWWARSSGARVVRRVVLHPLLVWVVSTVALWFWHVPGPYQLALRSPAVHALEHLSFLVTSLLFWWVVLHPVGHRVLSAPVSVLYVFATLLQSGLLGVLLTFARHPWYPAHGLGARAWGMRLLDDQQLAGLLMWIPAGFVYLAAAMLLFLPWLTPPRLSHPTRPAPAPAPPSSDAVAAGYDQGSPRILAT